MTTPQTPLFQLPYVAEGESAYLYRQRLQLLVERLETVLASKAVSPPGASDLLAVATRVGVLETDQAAEDTRAVRTGVTFASGWSQPTNPGEVLRVWKEGPDVVRCQGAINAAAGQLGTASTTAVPAFTLPLGYRPDIRVIRSAMYQVGTAAPTVYRLELLSTGVVGVIVHTGGTDTGARWLTLDLSFRTVNT